MPDTILSVLERIAVKLEARSIRPAQPSAAPSISPAREETITCPPPGLPAAPPPPIAPPAARLPSKFVKVHGSQMHYLETGPASADPVLFVHGNPASSHVWRNIIPRLSPTRRCIAVDLIGMGRSDKPKIQYRFLDHYKYFEGFIAQLGLRDITLVVHDWGSALGFHYMKLHGGNVKAVAFLEAVTKTYPSWEEFPRREAPRAIADAFRACRGEAGRQLLIESDTNFIDLLIRPVVGVDLDMEALNGYWTPFSDREAREPVWRWPNEIPVAGDPPDGASLVEEFMLSLAQSPVPKLLIYHPNGVIISEPEVEWCRSNLKNLEIVRIEGAVAGPIHFLQERFPCEIGNALDHWISKL